MKSRSTLFLALLAALLPMTASAQVEKKTNPDEATYSIIGHMEYDNSTHKRYLSRAVGKNISFEYVAHRTAELTKEADRVVRFDSVETSRPEGMTKLNFWRYDDEIGEWIFDSEVRQGESQMESTMQTNIMLVIDNSKSLDGGAFETVQQSAIDFVTELYKASQGRNIFRVGVIGFSTVQYTRTRAISSLDADNYKAIIRFIKDLSTLNGTAFYYSLENAINMLEEDTRENIPAEAYKESRIYAFTDGLDQASIDDNRGLSTPTKYYEHLRPMMTGPSRKKVLNMPKKTIHSTIVTVNGGDMTAKQEALFDQRAQEICDDVRKLNDMSLLSKEFKQLAIDLVNSNYVLYCYIPAGASGKVGWTFDDTKTVKAKAPRAPHTRKTWVGLGLEGGYNVSYDGSYGNHETLFGGLDIDVAFRIASWWGLGFSLSATLNEDTDPGMHIGIINKFTFRNRSALLLGFGAKTADLDGGAPYIRLGWKFRSPWYVTATLYQSFNEDGDPHGLSIGVGYSIFGGR